MHAKPLRFLRWKDTNHFPLSLNGVLMASQKGELQSLLKWRPDIEPEAKGRNNRRFPAGFCIHLHCYQASV